MWMDDWILAAPPEALAPARVLFRFFETQTPCVVLSSSNDPAVEAREEACRGEGIPVLRRKGGGGTVLLGPGCVVLTLAFRARDLFNNAHYFRRVNALWIEALETAYGIKGLATRGISDISHGELKVAGTSVFRRKHLFVYQGSLLVDADLDGISRYLAHPSREPDYRKGRDHRSFLTTLRALGVEASAEEVARACAQHFEARASEHFAPEFLRPAEFGLKA
jgi:lipoate-protein ligase A